MLVFTPTKPFYKIAYYYILDICTYCKKEIKDDEEAIPKEGKWWHKDCLRIWLRKSKGC